MDQNTLRRIVRLAEVGSGDRVVEVGAGIGTLTLALAERALEVITPPRRLFGSGVLDVKVEW